MQRIAPDGTATNLLSTGGLPEGLSFAGGNLYVADYMATTINKYVGGQTPNVPLSGGIGRPTGVFATMDGLYLTDYAPTSSRALFYNFSSSTTKEIGSGFNAPFSIFLSPLPPYNIYVGDTGTRSIKMINSSDLTTTSVVWQFPPANPGTGMPFGQPYNIFISDVGRIYFTTDNGFVGYLDGVLGGSPVLVTSYGTGGTTGTGTGLHGIWVTKNGDVYVAEQLTNKIVKIPNGTGTPVPISTSNSPICVVACENY